MPNQIQAGTMIVHQSAAVRLLNIESEPYFHQWSSLGPLESSGLDQKVRAVGWNLFFMAGEIRAVVPAWAATTLCGGELSGCWRRLDCSISTASK